MSEEIANKVVEAYKANPMLTGLLVLNIGMFAGFGWHVNRNNDRADQMSKVYLERLDKLQSEIFELAKTCVVPEK